MQLVLFDNETRNALYPFAHTRPVADIRCGILTARERWERLLNINSSTTLTEEYLQQIFPKPDGNGEFLLVASSCIATRQLAKAVATLNSDEALTCNGRLLAARLKGAAPNYLSWSQTTHFSKKECTDAVLFVERPWDIFSHNEAAIRIDFDLLTYGRTSAALPDDVYIRGSQIFVEASAAIGAGTIINAESGPVYIGHGAEIMEGCMVRGPFALCDGATLKMGAKVYGGTTIGPSCKVGGEISNTVFFANSNKGHDGFLGNAVIGEWCNIGADTNCSNLKNNYDEVAVWDEAAKQNVKTGLTFCGLLMGDHAKCGINTMFNTGTVVGVSCNIWGSGFPKKFLPSFTWGGAGGMSTYQFSRAAETAERMMARRGKTLLEPERAMLQYVFEKTAAARSLFSREP